MKIFNIGIYYIPYKKSCYQIAKEEMVKVNAKELNSIITGATFIMLYQLNEIQARINVNDFANKVESKGTEILELIQIVGYFAAMIFAGIDIVKSLKKQDIAGIIAIACKYAVSVGLLYGLPDIFDIFRDLFE